MAYKISEIPFSFSLQNRFLAIGCAVCANAVSFFLQIVIRFRCKDENARNVFKKFIFFYVAETAFKLAKLFSNTFFFLALRRAEILQFQYNLL
ncbi:hypothetical protein EA033_16560 [Salmonella enterica]|nr:hypothetical protein [Salmonella enterica subsp. enterica serovar Gaminara]